jgi:hypothetical protein
MSRCLFIVRAAIISSIGVLSVGCQGDKNGQSGASATGGSPSSNGSTSGGMSAVGGRGQGGTVGSTAAGNQDYLPGDVFSPWEGGPAYYAAWSNGPSTDSSYFPIAVWLQAPDSANTASEYRDIGMNMHIGLWEGPTEVQLTAAAALPTTVISSQNSLGLTSPHASLIKAWMHQDEPDNAQSGSEDPVPPETVVASYHAIVAADATRPVYLNLGQGVAADSWYGRGNRTNHPEDYPAYAEGADILSFDTYPMNVFAVPDSEPDWKRAFHSEVAQNIWFVANGVDRLRAWVNHGKPVWVWIETTNFNGEDGFALTPDLVAAEVWMAIIHGARGIGYFCHVFSPSFIEAGLLADSAMTAKVREINLQIRTLAPVLNTQSVANGVTAVSANASVPVDTMVKRSAGATYVFAVGMRPSATTATFSLRGITGDRSVEVLGENRSLTAEAGVFEDSFSAHAVHIYRTLNQ